MSLFSKIWASILKALSRKAVPAPAPTPIPEVKPEPKPEPPVVIPPVEAPKPDPVIVPEPEPPVVVVTPVPVPEPDPVPLPYIPAPDPVPPVVVEEHKPEPTPDPVPVIVPEPAPVQEVPKPTPVPVPEVKPDPTPAPAPKPEATTIKATGIPIGWAVKKEYMTDKKHTDFLKNEAYLMSAENELKTSKILSDTGVYNFTAADAIVKFANDNKIKMHGHTLIWSNDSHIPQFLLDMEKTGDKVAIEAAFKKYIQTIVKHFAGKVVSWDVVNEPFLESGKINVAKGLFYKDCMWLRVFGPDYIKKAIQYAHEADPKSLKFINEYGVEFAYLKLDAMINLCKSLLADKVPLHGFGLQLHTLLKLNVAGLPEKMKRFTDLGLKIHLSEVDVSVSSGQTQPMVYTPEIAQKQADIYVGIFKAFMGLPEEFRFAITIWCILDPESYVAIAKKADKELDYPLLIDASWKRKPAYDAVLKAFK